MIDGGEPKRALVTGAKSHAGPLAARRWLTERLFSTMGWTTEGLLARARRRNCTSISRHLAQNIGAPMPGRALARRLTQRLGRGVARRFRFTIEPA